MLNPLSLVRVLVADDHALMSQLVSDVLRYLGFKNVTVVRSGREAMHELLMQKYDLIITDWRMNDMDGMDLLRFVRTGPTSPCKHIPIIFLTGNTEEHHIADARDAGVTEYLAKPVSVKRLVERIRHIIEHPRPFVEAPAFRGHDRRRHEAPILGGVERRRFLKRGSA